MYTDKKPSVLPILFLILVILLAAAGIWRMQSESKKDLETESAVAIQNAVERNARQCYVVEGVYPPNLAYMEDNYGLQVNTKKFYITYEAFASNLPPTVKVTPKKKDK